MEDMMTGLFKLVAVMVPESGGIYSHIVPIVSKCSVNSSCGTFPFFLCEALLNQKQLKHHYRIFVWWVVEGFLHHVDVDVIIQRIQVIVNAIGIFLPFSHKIFKKSLPSFYIACVVVPCSFWMTVFSTTWFLIFWSVSRLAVAFLVFFFPETFVLLPPDSEAPEYNPFFAAMRVRISTENTSHIFKFIHCQRRQSTVSIILAEAQH